MATDTAASSIIDVLSHRIEFIEYLLDGTKEKRTLVEELDVSRSTVDRAVRELEAVEFIEYQDTGYRLTLCGQLAAQEYQEFEDNVDGDCVAQASIDTTVAEAVDIIAQRTTFLERLLDDLMDKRELVEELGVSRSTVDRGIRKLEILGLIEYQDSGFAVTQHGVAAVQEYRRIEDLFGNISEMGDFLQWIPESEFDLNLAQLVDTDIVLPEPGDPWAMVNRHVQGLRSADRVRAILPLTGLHAMEVMRDRVVRDGVRSELVVAPEVAETFQSKTDYAELYEEMVETGRFEMQVHEGDIPYYLGILDETVQIGVDEDGEPRGLLETDSEEVKDWAEKKYGSYRQQEKILS